MDLFARKIIAWTLSDTMEVSNVVTTINKAKAYRNIESFHSLIKREWLNRFSIQNYSHAYRLVFEYIEAFYNTVRIHSHCDYMSPDEFEKLYNKAHVLTAS